MKNWKAIAAGVALAGALAVPGMALAQAGDDSEPRMYRGHHGHHDHRGPKGGHFFGRMAEKLDLTEGQKAQLKANREANKADRQASREKMRELHKQIREAIDSGADQATLDGLGAELGKLQVAKMQQFQEQRQQFEAILTDEQKARLEEMKAERKARWKERREERRKRHMDMNDD